MRLLHTPDLRFHEFFDEDLPDYAILSHRWGPLNEEVSYEEFVTHRKTGSSGYRKILDFCDWASARGYQYVWIDTCCIDKRSSAELSEAINSMYSWYAKSRDCVAYLADIQSTAQDLTQSDWFTRGWTLQELIAPEDLLFVTDTWKSIGRKRESAVAKAISTHTGIPVRVLKQPEIVHDVSVARRLSWAARRRTTKAEDMAYCLLGLLDVNMPLLYGEGNKAFIRLQLQILDQYDDESIFAWAETSRTPDSALRGLLARSPSQFANCGSIVLLRPSHREPTQSMRITRRNVEFYGGLLQSRRTKSKDSGESVYLHQLKCAKADAIGSYLDVPVAENMLKKGKIQPCFIALSRRSHGDPFSRVRVSLLPWTMGGYSECKMLSLEPKTSICVRTSFSVAARFDNTYRGDDLESIAGDSVAGGRTTGRRHDSYEGPSIRRSDSSHSRNSGNDDSRRASLNHEDLSRRHSGYSYGEYTSRRTSLPQQEQQRGPSRRYSDRPGRSSLPNSPNYAQNNRRTNDRRSDQPGRYSLPNSPSYTQNERRTNDRQDPQSMYPIPENTYADGATYNDAVYDQPNILDNAQRPWGRQYPPTTGRTRPEDRRFSDPAALAGWVAQLRAQEALETRPSNKPRSASNDFGTACGDPCTLITCTSSKGHSYAKGLRLKGDAWHEYAEKLLRSGWDFEDVP